MFKTLMTAALTAGVLSTSAMAVQAQTIRTLIVQEDDEKDSLPRGGRIQRAVLNSFNAALTGPNEAELLRNFGIDGIDVYDEVSLTLPYDEQGRARRNIQELISVVRTIRNPRIDIVVPYTLYVKAVDNRYDRITRLQMALSYRALDVRSGRYLGGDNIDIDTDGIPMTGCAAGPKPERHCVIEFVNRFAERLVQDASVELARQIASMAAGYGSKDASYGGAATTNSAYADDAGKPVDGEPPLKDDYAAVGGDRGGDWRGGRSRACQNRPTEFRVAFKGMSRRDIRFLTEQMDMWPCRLSIDLDDASPSQAAYVYKVRANEAQLCRSLELSLEFMGVLGQCSTQGRNGIIVQATRLRRN